LFSWKDPLYDDELVAAVEESTNRLAVVAKTEGLRSDHPTALYGNYVDANTPLVEIYGDNLPRLRALRAEVDPDGFSGWIQILSFDRMRPGGNLDGYLLIPFPTTNACFLFCTQLRSSGTARSLSHSRFWKIDNHVA